MPGPFSALLASIGTVWLALQTYRHGSAVSNYLGLPSPSSYFYTLEPPSDAPDTSAAINAVTDDFPQPASTLTRVQHLFDTTTPVTVYHVPLDTATPDSSTADTATPPVASETTKPLIDCGFKWLGQPGRCEYVNHGATDLVAIETTTFSWLHQLWPPIAAVVAIGTVYLATLALCSLMVNTWYVLVFLRHSNTGRPYPFELQVRTGLVVGFIEAARARVLELKENATVASAEISRLKETLTHARRQLASLSKLQSTLDEKSEKLAKADQKIAELELDLGCRENELFRVESDRDRVLYKMEKQRNAHRSAIQKCLAENAEYIARLEAENEQLLAPPTEPFGLSKRLRERDRKIESLAADKEILQREVESRNQQISELQTALAEGGSRPQHRSPRSRKQKRDAHKTIEANRARLITKAAETSLRAELRVRIESEAALGQQLQTKVEIENRLLADLKAKAEHEEHLQQELQKKEADLQRKSQSETRLQNELQQKTERETILQDEVKKQGERETLLRNKLQQRKKRQLILQDEVKKQGERESLLQHELQQKTEREVALQDDLRRMVERETILQNELQRKLEREAAFQDQLQRNIGGETALQAQLQQKIESETVLQRQLQQKIESETALQHQLQQKLESETALQNQLMWTSSREKSLQHQLQQKIESETALQNALNQRTGRERALQDDLQQKTESELSLQTKLQTLHEDFELATKHLSTFERRMQEKWPTFKLDCGQHFSVSQLAAQFMTTSCKLKMSGQLISMFRTRVLERSAHWQPYKKDPNVKNPPWVIDIMNKMFLAETRFLDKETLRKQQTQVVAFGREVQHYMTLLNQDFKPLDSKNTPDGPLPNNLGQPAPAPVAGPAGQVGPPGTSSGSGQSQQSNTSMGDGKAQVCEHRAVRNITSKCHWGICEHDCCKVDTHQIARGKSPPAHPYAPPSGEANSCSAKSALPGGVAHSNIDPALLSSTHTTATGQDLQTSSQAQGPSSVKVTPEQTDAAGYVPPKIGGSNAARSSAQPIARSLAPASASNQQSFTPLPPPLNAMPIYKDQSTPAITKDQGTPAAKVGQGTERRIATPKGRFARRAKAGRVAEPSGGARVGLQSAQSPMQISAPQENGSGAASGPGLVDGSEPMDTAESNNAPEPMEGLESNDGSEPMDSLELNDGSEPMARLELNDDPEPMDGLDSNAGPAPLDHADHHDDPEPMDHSDHQAEPAPMDDTDPFEDCHDIDVPCQEGHGPYDTSKYGLCPQCVGQEDAVAERGQ
ncbi:tetratricopeptide repeat protein [Teratosphaeria destructans]|uniref:Tetratricopeptide repeat protein n=1 Tax=Teratosphaeria destructans TaxID=418781 RepID=A0A9W7SPD6_9PEZI|nr:tetratricopeptide repeat protein [Teratosphaeria destructans]